MTVHRAFLSLVDSGQVRLEGVHGTIPSLTLASAAAHLATSLEHEGFTAVKVDLGAPVRVTLLTESRLDGEVMSGGSSRLGIASNPGLSIEVVGRAGGE
tara:strand:+ start:3351 stop:3647 length:297 start_codon:yes stop_codon:yes gene_type:complete